MPADAAAAAADAQRRYWGRVLAATMRLARDVDVAEEATADAFLLALADVARARRARLRRGVAADGRPPAGDRPHPAPRAVARAAGGARRRARRRSGVAGRHRRRRAGGARRRAAAGRAVLPPGARPRGPGRPHAAPRVRCADGGDRRGVPRLRADDGGPAHPGQGAHRRVRRGHRPARRRRRRGAHAGRAAHGPPRLHDGPHGRHRRRRCATTTWPPTPCAWPGRCTGCARTTASARACWRSCVLTEARAAGGGRRRDRRSCSPMPTGRRGTAGSSPRAWRSSTGSRSTAPARSDGRPRSPPSTPAPPSFEATDWDRIIEHYDALLRLEPSVTIAIGRCVALSYPVRSGDRARRPRRRARHRRPRRLPVRPRRPRRAARPARAHRRGGDGVGQGCGMCPIGCRAGLVRRSACTDVGASVSVSTVGAKEPPPSSARAMSVSRASSTHVAHRTASGGRAPCMR